MLNQTQHKIHLSNILLDLYRDSFLVQHLGFKGGTAAYFFYDLPRFSVDLDFDLIGPETEDRKIIELIDRRINKSQYFIKDQSHKYKTMFWLLSYGKGEANIKLEVSNRRIGSSYENKILYGVQLPVMTPGDMLTNKLVAIQDRTRTANRDLFDAHYFLSGPYVEFINENIIKIRTEKSTVQFFEDLLVFLQNYQPKSPLEGLGELLTPKQKDWVRNKMLTELIGLVERQIRITF